MTAVKETGELNQASVIFAFAMVVGVLSVYSLENKMMLFAILALGYIGYGYLLMAIRNSFS